MSRFYRMQKCKESTQSLQFASIVASVVAFMDTYSPQCRKCDPNDPQVHLERTLTERILTDSCISSSLGLPGSAVSSRCMEFRQFSGTF
jgi:hypothetical protein